MYAQLGNIRYEGVNSFGDFSRKDTTTYAQYDLVNGKPRLQPVGNDLEQISIAMTLRAEFTTPTANILALKKSKDNFEVLPLVMGDGRYIGDYVITEMSEVHNITWMDGSLIEASISLSLTEYQIPDKLQQQQIATRKLAFAVGNKKPVHTIATQKPSLAQDAASDLSAVKGQGFIMDKKSAEWEQNVSGRADISNQMQSSSKKMNASLVSLLRKTDEMFSSEIQKAGLKLAVNNAIGCIQAFNFPPTDGIQLATNNRDLQLGIRALNKAATIITNPVILRSY